MYKMNSIISIIKLFTIFIFTTNNNRVFCQMPFFLEMQTCRTKKCLANANNDIISSVNNSIDPCTNFYDFVCLNWETNSKKPNSEASWSRWEPLLIQIENEVQQILNSNFTSDLKSVDKAKRMYQACLHFDHDEQKNVVLLTDLLKSFGGWPILNLHSNLNNSYHEFWLSQIIKISSTFNTNPLIKFHVSLNMFNTSEPILYIDHPTFPFPKWVLLHPNTYKLQFRVYVKWILKTVIEIAKISRVKVNFNDIKEQVMEIIALEIKIANLTQNNDENNISNLYKIMTVKEIQLWTDLISIKRNNSTIKWKNVINDLLNTSGSGDRKIIVKDLVYLMRLLQLIDKTSPKTLANYFGWCIVRQFAKETTHVLEHYAFEIDKILYGVETLMSRQNKCVIKVKKEMNLAISYDYIKKHVDSQTKKEVEMLVKNIQRALLSKIKTITWMDSSTKDKALEKAESINVLVAYPDYYQDVNYIEDYFKNLHIEDNHFHNMISASNFRRRKEFMNLKNARATKKWRNSPMDVNAYYNILENSVIIPSGIIQFPFYQQDRISALNYGALGTLIAHELSHAFDNTGRQADKNGNINEWWTKNTLNKFSENLDCFRNHYQKYFDDLLKGISTDQKWNSEYKTQDENIADVLGLEIAFQAYQQFKLVEAKENKVPDFLEKFTADQLFFVSYAAQWCEITTPQQLLSQIVDDDHTPNKIRVLGVLSNSKDFNKVFSCGAISEMNAEKKCDL